VELHPGVHVALARGRMDEAQLARAIAAGELASPQSYGNSWFFDLRITGVGGAYREAHKEYVWRDPSLYLNQGFLDRCNGLPIILEHPDKEMLDSKEYHDRNIGSIVYPYLGARRSVGLAASWMRPPRIS
jgi:colicin import membrane protein